MQFESLWPLAFLLAVPVVVILYLLVPKGKDTVVSSNLLWQKLFYNEQSKTFLEKFIHNLLMYLQIVIVLLLVLALMSPFIAKKGQGSGNVIYVLDTSGSMKMQNPDGSTRLKEAVKEIKAEIAAGSGSVSIVTNDGSGTNLLAVNSADKKMLEKTLNQVECTDTAGTLSDAIQTVQTIQGKSKTSEKTAVIVYTDGIGAKDADAFKEQLQASVCVMGTAVSNVANTFLSCTKENDGYTAAAGVVNYSDHKATLEITLYEENKILDVRTLSLKADESYTCLFEKIAWKGKPLHTELSAISFEGTKNKDALDADNCAYALMEQSTDCNAALIGEGNTYIEKAYLAVTGETLPKAKALEDLEADQKRVLIFDEDTAKSWKEPEKQETEKTAVFVMLFEKKGENTKEHVQLTAGDTELTEGLGTFSIGVNRTQIYDLPVWATGFLWNGQQCAAYYGEHDGIREVVFGFDLRESDFALQPEFPVVINQALDYLSDRSLLAENVYEAGEQVLFHASAATGQTKLLAPTDQAGLFTVTVGEETEPYVVRFARSQSDGRITAETEKGSTTGKGALGRQMLRRGVLFLVIVLLVVEWLIYVRQMRYRGRFYLGVRFVVLSLCILALCGISVPLYRSADTTVFLVDLSESNQGNVTQMEQYLKEQVGRMPKGNQYAVVTFGANPVVEQFLTKDTHVSSLLSTPEKSATDLESAVSAGLSMIPENAAGRLVVLTDGKQTKGNVARTASALMTKNVQLLSILYEDTVAEKDAYIETVEMPDYLYPNDRYSVQVTVVSNYETDAVLQLLQGTKKVNQTKVHLNKGSNRFVLKQTVQKEEAEQYTVKINAPEDGCAENDSYNVYAAVDTLPKILVITGMKEDSTPFMKVLDAAGCNYRRVTAVNAPCTLEEMLQYKSILLENVYREDLPDEFLQQIKSYVKDYGCGLIACGGEDSFALGGYKDTELETVLPVNMQLQGTNEKQNQAMVMVIDHSGSMSEDTGEGTNLDLAITAANAAVDQLDDKDEVGVVTFDDTYTWQVPLEKASDKEAIKKKISKINEGGGTTIKPAVRAALEAVLKSSAQKKHIVLLTDGEGETKNFDDVIKECTDNKVTLSTVAVGEGADTALLEQLAKQCKGRYYYSDISTDIPKIFAQEVFLNGDSYLQNGTFALKVNHTNAITKELFADGWPSLNGYVSASKKTGANVLIASEKKDDPILSVMQYGLGHTVAWNTDVTGRWSGGFSGSSDYVQLWKRIIDYSAGNTSLGEDRIEVQTINGVTTVIYHAKDYDEQTTVEAVDTDPDGNTHTVRLSASAPGTYEGDLDTLKSGVYNLSVRRMQGEELTNAVTTAAVVQYSDEYKFALTNETYLAFMKQYGKEISQKTNIWKKLKTASRADFDLTNLCLILLLFLFLMDIAMRRFSYVPKIPHWTKSKKKSIINERQKEPDEQSPAENKSPAAKPKEKMKTKKKEAAPQTLDTSALLKKKEKRHQS